MPLMVTRLFFKNDPDIDHGIEDLAIPLEEDPVSAGSDRLDRRASSSSRGAR